MADNGSAAIFKVSKFALIFQKSRKIPVPQIGTGISYIRASRGTDVLSGRAAE